MEIPAPMEKRKTPPSPNIERPRKRQIPVGLRANPRLEGIVPTPLRTLGGTSPSCRRKHAECESMGTPNSSLATRGLLVVGATLALLLARFNEASAQHYVDIGRTQFVIKHDVHSYVSVARGDTLRIHVMLLNAADQPVKISWGSRLFVLEATLVRPGPVSSPINFPPTGSWGKVERWEFPNPNSAYVSSIIETVLGARQAKNANLRVPFDSSGSYSIRVCVDLVEPGRICTQRDINVVVK